MNKTERVTTTFRRLIAKGTVMMPGVPNAAMARQVERAGFEAIYVSGAGMANATAGVPDIGLLTMTEVARLAGYIAKAVKIPAIVDADTGFGGSENVARTIQELEKAGYTAHRLRPGETRPTDGIRISGIFGEPDEQNRLRRAVIGSGAAYFDGVRMSSRPPSSPRSQATCTTRGETAACGASTCSTRTTSSSPNAPTATPTASSPRSDAS